MTDPVVTPEILELQRIIASPLYWSEYYLHDPKTGNPFQANTVQVRVLSSQNRRNVINVHRRAGKCALESDRLYLADGTLTTYGHMVNKKFELLTLVGDKIEKVEAYAEYNDFEEVYELELESGQKIVRNAAHPLFKGTSTSRQHDKPIIESEGWTPVGELHKDDLVAVPRILPFQTKGLDISDEEISLIAYLLGGGGLTQDSVRFTQLPGQQLEDMKRICNCFGTDLKQLSRLDWNITKREGYRNPVITLLKSYDLMGKSSHTKRVPSSFYNLDKRQLAVFLRKIYSTDGWACQKSYKGVLRGAGEIGYSSVSRNLIDDLQHFLLRFGIHARVDEKKASYSLVIDDFNSIILFCDQIGIFGKENACNLIRERSENLLNKKYGKSESLTWENGKLYKRYTDKRSKPEHSHWPLRRKIDVTPWQYRNAPPEMQWERIKSVKKLAEKAHTVGITVPEHHTYLTDLYEHNTTCFAVAALYYALNVARCEILYIAPRLNQVQLFWDMLESFINDHPFIKDCSVSGTKNPFVKKFSNGSIIKGFTTGSGSSNQGDSVRGQGGDVIFLDEVAMMDDKDFASLQPIINGDKYRRFPPIVFAASTPRGAFGRFYRWCTNARGWNRIRVPITENPEFSPHELQDIRETCTDREWKQEYLVEFLDTGVSVYPRTLVVAAACGQKYAITAKPEPRSEYPGEKITRKLWRTMGVDWDKFNEDGSGPNIVIIEIDERLDRGKDKNGEQLPRGDGKARVIYRESIPQSPTCLNEAIKRIITLNYQMNPDAIYVDPGQGENQIEVLKLYGLRHPTSRLDKKVRRMPFNGTVPIIDPVTHETIKKPAKEFMVNLIGKWLEDSFFEYATNDETFKNQLIEYKFKSRSATTERIKYVDNNDHIIAAAGLAALAMFQIHTSPFRLRRATTSYILPPQERMASSEVREEILRDIAKKSPTVGAVLGVQKDPTVEKNRRFLDTGDMPSETSDHKQLPITKTLALTRTYIGSQSFSSRTTSRPYQRPKI